MTYDQIPTAHDGEAESSSLEVREEEEEEEEKNTREGDGLAPPSSANHRYQNCLTDDEEDDYDYNDDDDCDDGDEEEEGGGDCDDGENEEEESYDSYFSLQMEKERQQAFNEVSSAAKPIACCSPDRKPAAPVLAAASQTGGRDRSQYVHSVLNPVENLSQWKSVKAKTGSQPLKNPRKENISLEGGLELPDFKLQMRSQKISGDSTSPSPISVDASLSNWLPSSGNLENSPCRSNSSVSREERPILGALTAEDLKKSPASSFSPRKSPSRSPDDMPILGTVGSYWSRTNLERDSGSSQRSPSDNSTKGIPNTTSKYREDRRVNWHSTPFEIRLERTLNRGDAEAY
ncbi:unnamed protein product [Spirodela intermedia]|uniref:Uncharacterized protein n=1 Tax=Spirodela intermedia TaxID=51605 RepID=A0A7I8K360_SPIIN|nr:unnamed protein product [Spirodela intermedia]